MRIHPLFRFLITSVVIGSSLLSPFSPPQVAAAAPAQAQFTTPSLPYVAIHVSEQTLALEGMPASGLTPVGPGTTGYEWWTPWWHYFVMPESLKEMLRSDGTPFVVVTDADIAAGNLRHPDGSPCYPIVISLAAEAVTDAQTTALRNYVNAGGFLFVGSSSFTRRPDGTNRGNFALASEMGLSMAVSGHQNWVLSDRITRLASHRLVDHIPTGTRYWSLPESADENHFGISPGYIWQTANNGATVLANDEFGHPLIATRGYGNGQFIYYGAMQPLIGNGEYDVSMYAYVLFRRAIEWAFENAELPIVKLSPWQYAYDAAFIYRRDLENFAVAIQGIPASAQYEHARGVKGDYYFTTGTLRAGTPDNQFSEPQKAAVIANLQQAITLYGTTLGPHNGGLSNPNPTTYAAPTDYTYWHWGPDEALDITAAPITSTGRDYAFTSLHIAFQDVDEWFAGYDNGRLGCGALSNCPRTWAAPGFFSTREASYELLEALGVSVVGEQKLGVFPHATLSMQTNGRHFSPISLPTSEWYVGNTLAQTLEDHNLAADPDSVHDAVDFYYSLGALVNLYAHELSTTETPIRDYINYSITKPRGWFTNAVGVADWWRVRSSVLVNPTFSSVGGIEIANATISGATNAETAIELVLPGWASWQVVSPQIYLNGALADPSQYRFTNYGVKVRVGTSVTQVQVRYQHSDSPLPIGICSGEETSNYNISNQSGWKYRYSLIITNTNATALPAGYSVRLVLDTAALVTMGKLRADGNDLRVVWVNGISLVELDRVNETTWNSTGSEIWFKTQAAIPANSSSGQYYLYYGNPSAGPAPSNGANVYNLWDDFNGTVIDPSLWDSYGNGVTLGGGLAALAPATGIVGKKASTYALWEARLQINPEDDLAWWGFEQAPNDSANFIVFQEMDTGLQAQMRHNWTDSNTNIANPAGNLTAWHTYGIDWRSSQVSWLIDGNPVRTATNAINQGLYPSLTAFGVAMTVDWIRVRLLAVNEPMVARCGQPLSPKIWTGAVNNDWNHAANWLPVGVPVSTTAVTIPTGANITLSANAAAASLYINPGATINLGNYALTVQINLDNYGTLRQNRTCAGGPCSFLSIQNAAGNSTIYHGLIITPTSSMGVTSVAIAGHQICNTAAALHSPVLRCYDITPTNAVTATITFFYQNSEANNNAGPAAWHHTGSGWEYENSPLRAGNGDWHFVQAVGVDAYSPFGLDDQTPTAIELLHLTAQPEKITLARWLGGLLLIGLGSGWLLRKSGKQ
jgi:hypothetical protein